MRAARSCLLVVTPLPPVSSHTPVSDLPPATESSACSRCEPSLLKPPILQCRVNVVNVELAAVGANARGRTAAFPSRRPVLADQCRSRQGGLLTMRVQLHECSSAQKFRAHSRRYGSCGYRRVLPLPALGAPSFSCGPLS